VKILHKYVLQEHVGPLTFALTALTSILLLNYIAKQFGMLVGKGLPWTAIAEFFGLSIPFTVALTLPMAVLVATLYGFSRLAADNEITALKASGVGMVSILRPVLLASMVVTAVMLFFNDQILPRANHALAVLQSDIAQTKPTFALREQVINEVSPGKLYLRANHIEKGSNWMREVTIYDLSSPTRHRTIYADSGTLAMTSNRTDLLMTLYSGTMQDVPTTNTAELQRLSFQTDAIRVAGVANQFRKSAADAGKGNREMSVCEMQRDVDKARTDYQKAREILQAGIARSQMFHLNLDTSLTKFRLASQPRVTLGGAYCKFLGVLGGQLPGAQQPQPSSPPMPPIRPMPRPQPVPRVVPQRPSVRHGSSASHVPPQARPFPSPSSTPRESIPRTMPQHPRPPFHSPVPRPGMPLLPGRLLPSHGPFPPHGPLHGPFSRNGAPAIGRLTIQQQQAQQQTVMPSGLEAERIRLTDLQALIDSNEVEIHKKFALAVACFVFVLLGAPIALRFPRAGVGLTIGVSLFVFALYYVGLIAGASLGSRGIVPPWIAMWAPNVIFGVVGVILVGRMDKEGGSTRSGGTWEWLNAVSEWVGRRVLGMKRQAAA
jgi:lipopolysaccharide export system permease protein